MNVSIKDKYLNKKINLAISSLEREKIAKRIWQKDYTVWGNSPDEISNRLGWLDSVETISDAISEIDDFVQSVKNGGFKNVLLMGMGGSSLAPEVFRLTFGVTKGFLDLAVLDSTHPEAVKDFSDKLKAEKTLFIVSTKSGGTIETISFMKYFYTKTVNELGKDRAGNHFIAITDPGSGLESMAKELNFRKIFLNDPDIGGRFSALSLFGMVPAALVGVDLNKFIERAGTMVDECTNVNNNPAAELGVILGVLAKEGIDKLTLISSPQIKYFGGWAEQLIAESTGKNGMGVLPIDLENLFTPEYYSKDRLFVHLKMQYDSTNNNDVKKLMASGFPVIEIELGDIYDLGKEFFRWEFATAIAGWVLGIQPFDQPDVESAKVQARKMMKEYTDTGKLPELTPLFTEKEISVIGNIKANNIKDTLNNFLGKTQKGKSYVAIQAYIKPDDITTNQLQKLRTAIQSKYKVATSLGYGPRFLHSTGQLHKGDNGNGLFIQFIADPNDDLPIPDEPGSDESAISFGVLIKAQALGDREALLNNNRNVITFNLGSDINHVLGLIDEL
jgi:glucose-6-phosphate isomerase